MAVVARVLVRFRVLRSFRFGTYTRLECRAPIQTQLDCGVQWLLDVMRRRRNFHLLRNCDQDSDRETIGQSEPKEGGARKILHRNCPGCKPSSWKRFWRTVMCAGGYTPVPMVATALTYRDEDGGRQAMELLAGGVSTASGLRCIMRTRRGGTMLDRVVWKQTSEGALSSNMYASAFIGVIGKDHRALNDYDTFMYAGLVVFPLHVMKLLLSFDGAVRSSSTYVSNIFPGVSGSQFPSRRNHSPV